MSSCSEESFLVPLPTLFELPRHIQNPPHPYNARSVSAATRLVRYSYQKSENRLRIESLLINDAKGKTYELPMAYISAFYEYLRKKYRVTWCRASGQMTQPTAAFCSEEHAEKLTRMGIELLCLVHALQLMISVAREQGKVPDGSWATLPATLAKFAETPDIADMIETGIWVKTLASMIHFDKLEARIQDQVFRFAGPYTFKTPKRYCRHPITALKCWEKRRHVSCRAYGLDPVQEGTRRGELVAKLVFSLLRVTAAVPGTTGILLMSLCFRPCFKV